MTVTCSLRGTIDLLSKHWVKCVWLEVILLVIFLFPKGDYQVRISLELRVQDVPDKFLLNFIMVNFKL